MAGCEEIVFEHITQEVWDKLSQKVKNDFQFSTSEMKGSASKYGYTISWDMNTEAGKLTIQCTNKPASINCEVVNKDISNYIRSAL